MDPEVLVAGLAEGNEAAWRWFLGQYGRLIYAVARKFRLTEAEQDDVYQNACLAIYRSIHSLRDPDRLSAWIYGVTQRLAIDRIRRLKREGTRAGAELLVDLPENPGRGSTAEEELAALQEAALLHDLVAGMDPRCRGVIRALYLEDPPLSYKELSKRESMPLGSIGPARARCLKKLNLLLRKASNQGRRTTSGRGEGVPTRPMES